MAVNLLEMARLAENGGETKRAGIIMTFAEQSPLLRAISTTSIQGSAYSWVREASLGSVGFRQVGEAYAESTGTTEKLTETLKLIGGDLDVDNFLVETGGAVIRTSQEMMKAKALARQIGYSLIKGDAITSTATAYDRDGLHGLEARTGGLNPTANSSNILDNGNAALSVKNLDVAIQAVDNPTHLVMAKKMRVNLTAFLRNSSSITTDRNEFGQLVTSYQGLPILDADVNGDLAALAFNEDGGSNTSIYVLDLTESGVHMIQSPMGIRVTDLGEQDSKPVWRTRVEWYCGLADEGARGVARLFGITDATATA